MGIRNSIMIVDDDLIIRTLLTNRLEAVGYSTTAAGDANEALNQAEVLRPRLIVCDMHLPVWGSGGDVYEAIRKHQVLKAVPMIFITGLQFSKFKERYPALFSDPKVRLLGKPINWLMLEQAIFELIGESKPLRDKEKESGPTKPTA